MCNVMETHFSRSDRAEDVYVYLLVINVNNYDMSFEVPSKLTKLLITLFE